MAFVTTKTGDTIIIICTLLLFFFINLPRIIHIIRKISASRTFIANKNRLACNCFDLGFILNAIIFSILSIIYFRFLNNKTSEWIGNKSQCMSQTRL